MKRRWRKPTTQLCDELNLTVAKQRSRPTGARRVRKVGHYASCLHVQPVVASDWFGDV